MDKLKIFKILDIEETKDKDSIKNAYRNKLLKVNPEVDPEGFMELRQAFEEAVRLSDMPDDEEHPSASDDTPLGRWINKIENCYACLPKRIDPETWRALLSDDICLDFDTYIEARDALLNFMMNHFRLPEDILKLINETFMIINEKEELKERFPLNFLNFIEYQTLNEHFIKFNLFKGPDDADYDAFINEYLEIKEHIDAKNFDDIDKLFDDIERFDIFHPYLEIEKLKYSIQADKPLDDGILELLTSSYPDNIYIRYNLILKKWHEEKYDESYQELLSLIKDCPDHYPAKVLIAEYLFKTGDYSNAKEECENLLNLSSNDDNVYSLLKKANEYLIKDYEEKHKEGAASLDDILELGWCYYENERSEECKDLIKDLSPDKEHMLDYCNLLGRANTSLHEYEEALPLLNVWEKEILALTDDGSEKYRKRKRRYVLARYLQALCWFELSVKNKETEDESEDTPGSHDDTKEPLDDTTKPQDDISEINALILKKNVSQLQNKALDILSFDIDAWDDVNICMSCHSLKSQVLLELGMYQKCIDECMHTIELDKSYFPAYVFMQQAYEKLRDAQMVIDTFYQAVEIYADYVRPYTLAAKVYFYVQQYEDSKKIIKMARDRSLSEPELDFIELKALRYAAETYDQTREMIPLCDSLLKLLNETPSKDVGINEVYCEKIYAYMDIDEYSTALEIAHERVKACPSNEEFYRIRAKILYNMNNHKEALPIFEAHLRSEENDSSYLYGMAVCYEKLEQINKAIEAYEHVLSINSEHYNANSKLSNIYYDKIKNSFNRKDYDLAIKHALRQLEINESGYYLIECALVYIEGYEFDKASELLSKVMEIEPENLYAYNNMGWVYQLTKRNDEAIAMYQKSIELNKENRTSLPYHNLADLYLLMNQCDKAYEVLTKCKELFPDLNWNKLFGSYYERAKKFDEAVKLYEDVIKSTPSSENYYTERLALCYEAAKRYPAAKKHHKKYMALTKTNAGTSTKANLNMGDYYLFCARKYKKAQEYYLNALNSVKDKNTAIYLECLLHMAEISNLLGKLSSSKKYFNDAMEYFKNNYGGLDGYIDYPSYRVIHIFNLFKLHFFAGYYGKAEQYMKQLFCGTRCSCCDFTLCKEAHFAKAYCHIAKKEYKEALECLNKVYEEDSNDTRVRFDLDRIKCENKI